MIIIILRLFILRNLEAIYPETNNNWLIALLAIAFGILYNKAEKTSHESS